LPVRGWCLPHSRDKVPLAVKNAPEHTSLRAENECLRELVGISPKMFCSGRDDQAKGPGRLPKE